MLTDKLDIMVNKHVHTDLNMGGRLSPYRVPEVVLLIAFAAVPVAVVFNALTASFLGL